jgi:hypothetical protein
MRIISQTKLDSSGSARSIEPETLSSDKPEPPDDATPAQAKIWRDVVASFPPGKFPPETRELLLMYCAHAALAHELAAHQDEVDPLSKTGNRRMVALTRHGKMAMHISQQLGILPRINNNKKPKPKGPKPRKPWLSPSGKSLLMRDDD